jgi:hypothetical protein
MPASASAVADANFTLIMRFLLRIRFRPATSILAGEFEANIGGLASREGFLKVRSNFR